jgi:hypothetical protein
MRRHRQPEQRRDLTITKLERDDEGHWRCRITVDGQTYSVHRKYGSWMHETEDERRHLSPDIAAAIQAKVYPIEKREQRERQKDPSPEDAQPKLRRTRRTRRTRVAAA